MLSQVANLTFAFAGSWINNSNPTGQDFRLKTVFTKKSKRSG